MLEQIYPISFIVSLFGLIFWFFFQKDKAKSKIMSSLFIGGFFVYLFSLAFANGQLSYKLLILCRDLVIIGVVSQFFNFFKANTLAFAIMMAILLGVIKMSFWSTLTQTFPQSSIFSNEHQELLLELKPNTNLKSIKSITTKYNLKVHSAFTPLLVDETDLDDYYTLDIPNKFLNQKNNIIQALLSHPSVDWVEENETIQLDVPIESANIKSTSNFLANDPSINQQWGFDQTNTDLLHRFLNTSKVKSNKKALIAILDTGVDAKHEDLKENYRSIQSKSDNDPRGHGTHCAGIAGAVSNNGIGIASITPSKGYVEITSVKVLNGFGGGTQKSIIDGIIFAADKGADVISMSLGGRSSDSKQKAYEEAVRYANGQGAIVVVAAGNNSGNAVDIAPANVEGVITVSATNSKNEKAFFSNTVQDVKMGIAAPGEGIFSTIPKNKYASYNGTSMATPYVAGLVGMMKSFYPALTTAEVYEILDRTGKPTLNGRLTGNLIQPHPAILAILD